MLNEKGKLITAGILFAVAIVLGLCTACVPVPRTIPPGLSTWAAQKAAKLARCYDAGHRGQSILECMGDYAADRGTYACERTRAAVTQDH